MNRTYGSQVLSVEMEYGEVSWGQVINARGQRVPW